MRSQRIIPKSSVRTKLEVPGLQTFTFKFQPIIIYMRTISVHKFNITNAFVCGKLSHPFFTLKFVRVSERFSVYEGSIVKMIVLFLSFTSLIPIVDLHPRHKISFFTPPSLFTIEYMPSIMFYSTQMLLHLPFIIHTCTKNFI